MANSPSDGDSRNKPPAPPPSPGTPAALKPGVPSVRPLVPTIAPLVPPVMPVASSPAPKVSAAPPPSAKPAPTSVSHDVVAELLQRTSVLETQDYFEVLRLEKSATPADIKRAFYRESRTYHPDRFFHLTDPSLKERVTQLYKRVTEAYFHLRDDRKRKKYLEDVSGPDRAKRLRFDDVAEAETKFAAKKEHEEQIGTHPKGRQFFLTGMKAYDGGRWSEAERNFKMALTYEPANARYKDKLADVQQKLHDDFKSSGHTFKIK
ncbi:MAG: J domain-containing protein [Myxococcaceae bacterium]